jgi:hypothetical protein
MIGPQEEVWGPISFLSSNVFSRWQFAHSV